MATFPDSYFDYETTNGHSPPDRTSDPDFSLTSPTSDSTGFNPSYQNPPIQNLFQFDDQTNFDYFNQGNGFQFTQQSFPSNLDYTASADKLEAFDTSEPYESKLNDKSKRIAKRTVAKERRKCKQDLASLLVGIDPKMIPKGFDDPNLDEKTRKKMVTMMRNRISAQNSRDRKKAQMQELEDINSKVNDERENLRKEKDNLYGQIKFLQQRESQLLQEIEMLKQSNLCPNCRREHSNEPLSRDELQQISTEESGHDVGGLSGLSSPILSRFSSAGRGFLTFFAFATVLSVIMMGMTGNINNQAIFSDPKEISIARHLEANPTVEIYPKPIEDSVIDPRQALVRNNGLVIQNFARLKSNFDANYHNMFKSHLQQSSVINDSYLDSQGIIQFEDSASNLASNAIVTYNDKTAAKSLRMKTPVLTSKMVPVNSQISDKIYTSTLFCPRTFEVPGPEEEIEDNEFAQSPISIENADFLQLFVPKHTIERFNRNMNLTALYDIPISESNDQNSVLEIWCKVFLVRELQTSF